jgi:hypothetical protein
MEKYYSKVKPDLLLHVIFRFDDFIETRTDILEPNNFLQCSALRMEEGKTFFPHKHIEKEISYDNKKTQESWVVMRGLVKCTFYDIDDTILAEPYLREGDASFTLHGGHTYTIMEDHTCVFEMKTGPYHGQQDDKEFII